MSRSGAFYVIKAMEPANAGAAAADAPGVPARRAVDHQAVAAGRPAGGFSFLVRLVWAAVQHGIGGAAGSGDRRRWRLGRAARAD